MVKATLTAPNLAQFRRACARAPTAAGLQWQAGITAGAAALRAALVEATPKRTGQTAAQWRVRVTGSGMETTATVENPSPVAALLVTGTRRHLIVPRRRGGVLAFSAGGQRVFARRVMHPGTRPNDYVERGLAAAGPKVLRIMERRATALLYALKGA